MSNELVPQSDATLEDIYAEWKAILKEIDQLSGEVTPELEARMNMVETNLPEKIDGYAYVMDRLEMEEAFWKKREDEAAYIKDRFKQRREFIKSYLKMKMVENGKTELLGNVSRFYLKKCAKSLDIYDENALPATYSEEVLTLKVNSKQIKEDLENGIEVPGARLIGGAAFTKGAATKLLTRESKPKKEKAKKE